MASTTSSASTFLSSPRSQRMLMWISGAILVVGIAIFLGVFFGRGSSQDVHSGGSASSTIPDAQLRSNPLTGQVDDKQVPASPAARNIARTFLTTAVARKNLAAAYPLVGPWLKGESRAQWLTGNNPVQYVPAVNLKTAPMKVLSSTKDSLLLEVESLLPAKGKTFGGLHSLSFQLEVDRVGGKWLVQLFNAEYDPGKLATQGAGSGDN